MTDFVIPADTIHRQRRASDPASSAWVSANAGAGKTRVLTDRVIRLLLADVPPSRILCLTFTKAAAAEMTIRVFGVLGEWVTLPEAELRGRLEALTGERPGRDLLLKARRLFARAVETPGGLKIETIHAFCERVLHLMPFEAGVPPRFAVMDESQTAELLAEARAAVLAEAALEHGEGGGLAAALDTVARYCSGDALTRLIDGAVLDDRIPSNPDPRERALGAMRAALGLGPRDSSAEVGRAMLEDGIPPAEWPALAAELRRTGKPSDAGQADALAAALVGTAESRLAAYRAIFFTDKGLPRKTLATKGVDPAVCALLAREQDRLAALDDTLAAALTFERTAALVRLAGAVRTRAEAQKRRLGALDFADLIRRTLELLDRGSAPWVLYKLDRGIDHVLVDEAQDTNPDQWRILRRLTEEFTAGAGRPSAGPRTIFAVGDPKQSIYSFQGADPRWFEDSRRHWLTRSRGAELSFHEVTLDLSFRSAPAILRAVDRTFGVAAHFRGLSFAEGTLGTAHESARPTAPGRVEIWPTQLRAKTAAEPEAWTLPVDMPEESAPSVQVALRVAKAVKAWTTAGDGTGRTWRAGEILILVRSRGPAFFAVIRALKKVGVPVAGADRFDIGEHIAVHDLVAAGNAALLPRNDLAVAAALKSPLVGLDDDDLIRIASDRGREESLADALKRLAEAGDAKAGIGWAALCGWRDLARSHGPFGFYATLLGPGGARRRLIERLGGEAADAIDAFLVYVQAAEFGPEVSSLAGFLARFESAAHTIKRDLDAGSREVKVMTVHGAKGLEAPLVVVIDGCDVWGQEPLFVPLGAGDGAELPVWSPGKSSDSRAVAVAREAAKDLRQEEHHRLLYVAMTRARDRLVIAPFASRNDEPPQAWCAMVRRGFADATEALVRTEMPYGPADVWSDGTLDGADVSRDDAGSPSEPLPAWLLEPVVPERDGAAPLSPSAAAVPASEPGEPRAGRSPEEARRRGILIHALLQHLGGVPETERPGAGAAFLAGRAAGLSAAAREELAAEALRTMAHPGLSGAFGPGSRAEAPIAGRLRLRDGSERAVIGQVDRLAVADDEVLLADFKTGAREPGDVMPEAVLAQMALYRSVLQDAFPGRPVRAVIGWTATAEIVELDAAALDRALGAVLAASP